MSIMQPGTLRATPTPRTCTCWWRNFTARMGAGILECDVSFTRDPVPKVQSIAVLLVVTALATLLGASDAGHGDCS